MPSAKPPTLVLLAAGMSTRYGRLKQLEPVGPEGEALLDYSVFDARRAGVRRILLIIREELREAFEAHTRDRWPRDLEIAYHYQRLEDLPGLDLELSGFRSVPEAVEARTKPWGTAHALFTARGKLPGPFMVLNADDFYGESAFFMAAGLVGTVLGHDEDATSGNGEGTAGFGFAQIGGSPGPTFGLVTYTLRETLSPHGGVNRGVCEVDVHGSLGRIREILDIRPGGDVPDRGGNPKDGRPPGLVGRTVEGQILGLTGDEPISTNFWIFTPDVFPLLQGAFREFMGEVVQNPEGQPEFLIPPVVNGFLKDGRGRVQCVSTHSRFLGITHPEDRQGVVDGLEEMTAAGDYPRPLWT